MRHPRFFTKWLAMLLAFFFIIYSPSLPVIAAEFSVSEAEIQEIAGSMTLRQKVGQMIFIGISTWTDKPGMKAVNFTEMNDAVAYSIRKNQYGGFMLYRNNLEDKRQRKWIRERK